MAKLNKADAMALLRPFTGTASARRPLVSAEPFAAGAQARRRGAFHRSVQADARPLSAEPFAAGGTWPGAKKAPELHATTARLTDQGDCGLVALHMLWHGVTPGPVRWPVCLDSAWGLVRVRGRTHTQAARGERHSHCCGTRRGRRACCTHVRLCAASVPAHARIALAFVASCCAAFFVEHAHHVAAASCTYSMRSCTHHPHVSTYPFCLQQLVPRACRRANLGFLAAQSLSPCEQVLHDH